MNRKIVLKKVPVVDRSFLERHQLAETKYGFVLPLFAQCEDSLSVYFHCALPAMSSWVRNTDTTEDVSFFFYCYEDEIEGWLRYNGVPESFIIGVYLWQVGNSTP